VQNKLPVSVKQFSHFEYCFNSQDHRDYLKYLESLQAIQGQQIKLIDNQDEIIKQFHERPQITYGKTVFRKATPHKILFIKTKKAEPNKFQLDYKDLQIKTNGHYLNLHGFTCIKSNQVVNPELVKITYAGINLNVYGKCTSVKTKNHDVQANKWDCFPSTFEFDYDIPILSDIMFTVEDQANIPDFIGVSVHAESVKPMGYDNKNILTNQVVTNSHILLGKLDGIFTTEIKSPGYFNTLYLWSEQFDKIDGLTVKNDGVVLVDDTPPVLLKKSDKLVEVVLGHVNCGQTLSNLQITWKSNTPVQIEVYGKSQGIISFE